MTMLLPPHVYHQDGPFYPWREEFHNSYCLNRADNRLRSLLESFDSCYCLFPVVRKLSRDLTASPNDLDLQILLCSIMTDRGLLAEQTRDLFLPQGYNSRIATKLSYIPVLSPKERHVKCALKALDENYYHWKYYFFRNRAYRRFSHTMQRCRILCVKKRRRFLTIAQRRKLIRDVTYRRFFRDVTFARFVRLLSIISKACSFSHKTVSQAIIFPCSNDLNNITMQSDTSFPSQYESDYAGHTTIRFSEANEQPILPYLARLAKENNLFLTPKALTFFVCYLLKTYCNEDRTLSSISASKQYTSLISEQSIIQLHAQTDACYTMAAKLFTIAALKRSRLRSVDLKRPPAMQGRLAALLQAHIEACTSALVSSKALDKLQTQCTDFSYAVEKNWGRLSGNPYLIYRLWVSKSRKPFAHESTKYSLPTLLEQSTNPIRLSLKEGADKTTVHNANRNLYSGLLDLYWEIQQPSGFTKNDFLILFDDLEAKEGACQGLILSQFLQNNLQEAIDKNLNACLHFEPECLVDYPNQLFHPELLRTWLAGHPAVVQELQIYLAKNKGVNVLRRQFRRLFEKPSDNNLDTWNYLLKEELNHIPWDSFDQDRPPFLHYETTIAAANEAIAAGKEITASQKRVISVAMNDFHQFIVSWTLLSMEIKDAKNLLLKLTEVILSDFQR